MNIWSFIKMRPNAVALIKGSAQYPRISGEMRFYNTTDGVITAVQITGLPRTVGRCKNSIFALHIHSGESCTGNDEDPFSDALTHYNPHGCPHPYHAGDMPPLFSANGKALLAFLSDRFTINEIIGKAVVVHSSPDDFTTQPSGNSGSKIACGIIKRVF